LWQVVLLIFYFCNKNHTQNTCLTCLLFIELLKFQYFCFMCVNNICKLVVTMLHKITYLLYIGEVELVWRTLKLWRICFINRHLPWFLIKNWNFRVYDVTSCTSSVLYSNSSPSLSWFRCYNVMLVQFVDIL
jgi:hypothetical protein